jgi:flagellar L-ring protein precursor FlgH
MKTTLRSIIVFLPLLAFAARPPKPQELSPIDRLIAESEAMESSGSVGSTFEPGGRFAEICRDLRAANPGDLVTIVVVENASAVAKGGTASNRDSKATAQVSSFAGPLRTGGPLTNLANAKSAWELQGQGETSRQSSISTRLSARVTHVLANGNLVVEGSKEVQVNSERQKVTLRGIIRWNDLSQFNTVSSDRISDLEIRIDGKGVVQDAIRRPNVLYRILLGILPF